MNCKLQYRKLILSLILSFCISFFMPIETIAQNFVKTATENENGGEKDGKENEDEAIMNDPNLETIISENPNALHLSKEGSSATIVPEPYLEGSSQYTLGKTDVIEIVVNRHPEVSGQFIINNEGKIQYEFVGDILVEGLKKEEVKNKLTELLSVYIVAPEVTVKIIGYNSKIVYVVGEVAQPGKIFMRGDTITVREALIEAGLPLLSGVTKKSKLITPSENGNPLRKKVNVYALLYDGDLRENLVMKPGDILYIPPTFLTKAMRAIQPVAGPVGTAAGTGRSVLRPF